MSVSQSILSSKSSFIRVEYYKMFRRPFSPYSVMLEALVRVEIKNEEKVASFKDYKFVFFVHQGDVLSFGVEYLENVIETVHVFVELE